MTTLRNELNRRGITYYSQLTERADDIYFDDTFELCETLGYIARNINHLDGEYPADKKEKGDWNMPITDGLTSGGHRMKRGRQYRVYLECIKKCPSKIKERLHDDDKMRFGGGLFVEALLLCGFEPGYDNDPDFIMDTLMQIFIESDEQDSIVCGFNL